MNISIANTHTQGGAAAACLRLRNGLIQQGCSVRLVTRGLLPDEPDKVIDCRKFTLRRTQADRVRNWIRIRLLEKRRSVLNRPGNIEQCSFPESYFDLAAAIQSQPCDIINLHWVSGMLDYPSFFQKLELPVVWTLHDMNAFMGYEHFVEQVSDLDAQGKFVYYRPSSKEMDLNKRLVESKQRWVSKAKNLTVVTPSKWLESEAARSPVFADRCIHTIPYGLDTQVYCRNDSAEAKQLLGLDPQRKQLLFVSDNVKKARKGGVALLHALSGLKHLDQIELMVVGGHFPSNAITGLQIRNMGSVNDDHLMSMLYNAADAFVLPSLVDNLPNTMLESLACGTPVIAFAIGGVPDAVKDFQNGILCESVTTESLRSTIQEFLDGAGSFDRERIASDAAKHYALEIQATRYQSLFREVLLSHSAPIHRSCR
ncbi:MAG: glycosyltransferase [Puniceicoccaceae bacterium]